jgi:nucleoid DNA-binding protein
MNKRQLTQAAARRCDLTTTQTAQVLDALLETIAEVLASGDYVALADFGRFEVQEYPARALSRFGKPGQFTVASRSVPVFKSSAVLRRRVRGENREE